MGKIKARKVSTPGSQLSPGRGRPRKAMEPKKRGKRLQYSQAKVQQAIQAVKSKAMTLGEAAKHYKVPKTTIFDRIKSQKNKLTLGRPTELTAEEEDIIVQRLKVMGEWGFPLTSHDLRHLIKSYLDGLGKTSVRHVKRKLSHIDFTNRSTYLYYMMVHN
jgi:transposase